MVFKVGACFFIDIRQPIVAGMVRDGEQTGHVEMTCTGNLPAARMQGL